MLEGKMKINAESADIYHHETKELLGTLPKRTIIVSIENINNMPILCLSQYGDDSICFDGENRLLNIDEQHVEQQKCDFPDATHALIIMEPKMFLQDVLSISEHSIISDEIHYFDYGINDLQMYMFLGTGGMKIQTSQELSMNYENRYRHLLCKDTDFKSQKEYRFIGLDELIDKPTFYKFKFTSKYLIVPIDDVKTKININV